MIVLSVYVSCENLNTICLVATKYWRNDRCHIIHYKQLEGRVKNTCLENIELHDNQQIIAQKITQLLAEQCLPNQKYYGIMILSYKQTNMHELLTVHLYN